MKYKSDSKHKKEMKILTNCILKGMSNKAIAQELNYSRSTVAYKINKLFYYFNSSNRIEFILNVLEKIIKEKNNQIIMITEKLNSVESKYELLKKQMKQD